MRKFFQSLKEKCKKYICSVAVGMIVTGVLLSVFYFLYVNKKTSEIINWRGYISGILMSVGYMLFPYGTFEKRNEDLLLFCFRFLWAGLSAVGILCSVQYFLCNIPENSIGYEIDFSLILLFCCSYIIYLITCFGKALYRLIKKALSSRIDNGIKEATSKIETINKLIAAIAALIASLTPVILAVCAIVKI